MLQVSSLNWLEKVNRHHHWDVWVEGFHSYGKELEVGARSEDYKEKQMVCNFWYEINAIFDEKYRHFS